MATVFKRGKRPPVWYAQWRDRSGHLVQRRTSIAVMMEGKTARETKRMAEQLAAVMERTEKGEETVEAMIDCVKAIATANGLGRMVPTVREYLNSVPATSRSSSERNRQRAHAVFMEFLGKRADMRLDILSPELCRQFIRWGLKRVHPNTVNLYRGYLTSALKRAVVEHHHLSSNPFELASVSTEKRAMGLEESGTKRLPFTPEEMRRLMTDFPRPWSDMVAVSYYLAGLRLSDVCLLRWDAVDFVGGFVRLKEHKTRRERVISLLPVLRDRLLRIREEHRETPAAYVFPKMAERYLSRFAARISTDFTALLKAKGMLPTENDGAVQVGCRHRVNPKSFHSIRHSVVSFARISPDLTPDMVRETVGHSSEEVERAYFAANDASKAKVMSVLAEAVKPDES